MFGILNLNHHLDSDEKIVKFFRPSRLAYLFTYLGIIIFGAASLFLAFYDGSKTAQFIFWKFVNLGAWIVFAIIMIFLVRVEYRIWSRRYALTTERIMYSRGIFSEDFKSTRYKNITDISLQQSFWDKICNTGTLMINTAGGDDIEIRYRKIDSPLEIKKMISDGK